MKLHYAAASPFVRKVLVVADELGIKDQIELVNQAITPIAPADTLNADNPLGKIPALVLEDGTSLYDSAVIAEYLDAIGGGGLMPASGIERWQTKTLEAQADGICDALVLTRYETFLRPEAMRWPEWVRSQLGKAMRGLDSLEETADSWSDKLSIGTIAVGCALGYADFRFAETGWRDSRPKVAAWYEAFAARPSMSTTKPD